MGSKERKREIVDRLNTEVTKAAWIGNLVMGGLISLLIMTQTGCAGMGVKAEMYRIDERQESQATHAKPLRCLFVNCDSGRAS
jgi:hypothetical protein